MVETRHLSKTDIVQLMFLVPALPLTIGIFLAAIAAMLSYHHFNGLQFEEATVEAT